MIIGEFNVTFRDKDGNIIPDDKITETVIEDEAYYEKMREINKRIKEEYHFDKVL